jgi:RNA polymerase sigma-70 factor (ECF subfamily)
MAPVNPQRQILPGFEALFKTYYPSLCFFATQYLQNKQHAEDVVQSVFTRWLQETPSYQSEEHARNLLYKMVKQASLNEMRRLTLHAQPMDQLPENVALETEDSFEAVVRAEVYRQILQAIDQLPEACARVFKLSYLNQMDNEQVANTLSISINTVKVQKNRAKKRLQDLLKNIYPLCCLFLP